MQDLGLDIPHESHHSKDHTEDVDSVVSIAQHLTRAPAVLADLLIGLYRTRERLSDKRSLQTSWVSSARVARGFGEGVDKLEHKIAWECATEVRDAAKVSTGMRPVNSDQLTLPAESCRYRQ